MAGPPGLGFLQESVDPAEAGSFQDPRVGDFVLPPDVEESAETAHEEVVELAV